MSQTESYKLHTITEQEAQTELVRDFLFRLAGAGTGSNMSIIDSALSRLDQLTVNGRHPDENGNYGLYRTLDRVLSVSGWTGDGPYQQVLSVPELTAESDGFLFLGGTATSAQWNAAADACIQVSAPAGGAVTFTATGEKPAVDIPICLLLLF